MSKDYIAWSDSLSIGLQDMDDQHKVLLGLINQVWQGLVSHQALPNIEGVVFDLEDYAHTHFDVEEALMAKHGYPALQAHQESHAQFYAKVEDLSNKIASGETVGLELLRFISDWLTFHIAMVDRQYADYIRHQEEAAGT